MPSHLTEKQFFKEKQALYAKYHADLKPFLNEFQEAYRPLYEEFRQKAGILEKIYEKHRSELAKVLNGEMAKLNKRRRKRASRR